MRRLGLPRTIPIEIDGARVDAGEFDTVASALLTYDLARYRLSPVSGEPRAPYCMMGVCFECQVCVDGVEGVQGCLVRVRPGMKIRRQLTPPMERTAGRDGHR